MRRMTVLLFSEDGHGVVLQNILLQLFGNNLFICDNRTEGVQYYVGTTRTCESNTTSNPKDALRSSVKEHLTSSDPTPTANQFEICVTTNFMDNPR
jgi:hypothetical protein